MRKDTDRERLEERREREKQGGKHKAKGKRQKQETEQASAHKSKKAKRNTLLSFLLHLALSEGERCLWCLDNNCITYICTYYVYACIHRELGSSLEVMRERERGVCDAWMVINA